MAKNGRKVHFKQGDSPPPPPSSFLEEDRKKNLAERLKGAKLEKSGLLGSEDSGALALCFCCSSFDFASVS